VNERNMIAVIEATVTWVNYNTVEVMAIGLEYELRHITPQAFSNKVHGLVLRQADVYD
jgi:hypothetical protein